MEYKGDSIMSMDNFLSFLQQLLTMVEPENESSVALAKAALTSVVGLAQSSGKADSITMRAMMIAERKFEYLVSHREDYAGVLEAYRNNQIKRQRLKNMIMPSC